MSHRLYTYVGPIEILQQSLDKPAGCMVSSPDAVRAWAAERGILPASGGELVTTFVIDAARRLRLAERGYEHVACAGCQPVYAAGEMTFGFVGTQVAILEATNQSTGFCPESDCWEVVADVLTAMGFEHPEGFSHDFIFRRCDACGQINLVKDDWFVCAVCEADLDQEWNFGRDQPEGTKPR